MHYIIFNTDVSAQSVGAANISFPLTTRFSGTVQLNCYFGISKLVENLTFH